MVTGIDHYASEIGRETGATAPSHAGALTRVLAQLRGLRLRVTLCRIRSIGPTEPFRHRMTRIDDPTLLVEVAPDGVAFALYVGPRTEEATDPNGDRAIEQLIVQRLTQAMTEGPLAVAPERVELAVLHRWADGIAQGVSVFAELSQQVPRRLAAAPAAVI